MKRSLWLGLLLCALFQPAFAAAQDVPDMPIWRNLQLRAGLVGTVGLGDEHTLGLEASLPWFRDLGRGDQWDGVGPVVQWQRLHKHDRAMVGIEYVTSSFFGIEAGWAYVETADGPVQGLAVTPFFSLGIVTMGPRLFLPISEARNVELGLNFYLKVKCFGDAPHRWYTH
jgi:hypothetical protein